MGSSLALIQTLFSTNFSISADSPIEAKSDSREKDEWAQRESLGRNATPTPTPGAGAQQHNQERAEAAKIARTLHRAAPVGALAFVAGSVFFFFLGLVFPQISVSRS